MKYCKNSSSHYLFICTTHNLIQSKQLVYLLNSISVELELLSSIK